jgi:hypothetical protein
MSHHVSGLPVLPALLQCKGRDAERAGRSPLELDERRVALLEGRGNADIANRVADRLRVNKLALKVPAWVALAVARPNEVPGHLRWPPSFAECAATLAFGDELLVLPDDKDEDERQGDEEDDEQGEEEEEQQGDEEEDEQLGWRMPGGRDLAAVFLMPRAETALRQELLQSRCSGWPTSPRELAKARAHPRAARARCDGPRACWRAKARIGWIGRAHPRAARARCDGPRAFGDQTRG